MESVGWSAPRSSVTVALALVIALAAFRYGHDVVKFAVEAPFIDFATYYTYTYALWTGADPFDPAQLARVDAALAVRRTLSPPTFTPPGYLLLAPFTAMPYAVASLAWLALGQGCLLAALIVWRRCLAPTPVLGLASLFVVLTYHPIYENIAVGQLNLIMLPLVVFGIAAHVRGHSLLAALPLSWVVHLKPHYMLLIPFLYWVGSPMTATLTLVLAVAWFGLALVMFGHSWLGGYLGSVHFLAGESPWLHSWMRNLSPHAILHRLFNVEGTSVPIEAVSIALAVAIIIGVMRVTRGVAHRSQEATLAGWALAIAALPLVSPLTEEHHLVVLLIPLLFVIGRVDQLREQGEIVLVVAAAVLLSSRYSVEAFPLFAHGLASLAHTGKALGAAVLAIVAARLAVGARPGGGDQTGQVEHSVALSCRDAGRRDHGN